MCRPRLVVAAPFRSRLRQASWAGKTRLLGAVVVHFRRGSRNSVHDSELCVFLSSIAIHPMGVKRVVRRIHLGRCDPCGHSWTRQVALVPFVVRRDQCSRLVSFRWNDGLMPVCSRPGNSFAAQVDGISSELKISPLDATLTNKERKRRNALRSRLVFNQGEQTRSSGAKPRRLKS